MLMPFALLLVTGQCLLLTVAGIIMSMFRKLADQVSFLVIASILLGMLMLLHLTLQLFCYSVTAVVVMVTLTLLQAAGQYIFITAIVVLVLIYPA